MGEPKPSKKKKGGGGKWDWASNQADVPGWLRSSAAGGGGRRHWGGEKAV